jgi:hypothetical protein
MTIFNETEPTKYERQNLMMIEKGVNTVCSARPQRCFIWISLVGAILFLYGCGGSQTDTGKTAKYPVGISEDIEQQLKYDARVDTFEPDGQTLVVNVNETWLHSPQGMRERALGQWYSLWQPSHGNTSKIVVKHEGEEIESWTADKGYQPIVKQKEGASEG